MSKVINRKNRYDILELILGEDITDLIYTIEKLKRELKVEVRDSVNIAIKALDEEYNKD